MNTYSMMSSRSTHSCSMLQHGRCEHTVADAVMSMQLLMPTLSTIMNTSHTAIMSTWLLMPSPSTIVNMSPTVSIMYARMFSKFESAVLNLRLCS